MPFYIDEVSKRSAHYKVFANHFNGMEVWIDDLEEERDGWFSAGLHRASDGVYLYIFHVKLRWEDYPSAFEENNHAPIS